MMPEENKNSNVSGRQFMAVSLVVLGIGFGGGFLTERQLVQQGISNTIVGTVPQPSQVDFSPVWKAWNVINEKFVPAAVASTTPVASTTAQENQEKVWGMI